jgi:hypothetical protein
MFHPPYTYPPYPYYPPPSGPPIPGAHLPGGLAPGQTLLFPSAYTDIHVIRSGFDATAATNAPGFQIYKVPLGMTGNEFLERVGGGGGGDEEGWKMTEVYELGNNRWSVGMEVTKGDNDDAKKLLSGYGWARSGPVWVWVRRA